MNTTETATASVNATKTVAAAAPTLGTMLFSALMFGLSVVITAAFGYFLVTDPTRLIETWQMVRALPLLVQLLIWLLFLPWMIALWISTLPWAMPVRLVLVLGTLAWTNWLLFPWK